MRFFAPTKGEPDQMKRLRLITAVVLALCFAASSLPALAADSAEAHADRGLHSGVIIDTDPAGGYTGDYVVIYNSGETSYSGQTTGPLTGLIETEIYGEKPSAETRAADDAIPRKIDVDAEMEEQAKALGKTPHESVRETFTVGQTREFVVNSYNPAGGGYLTFKLLYQGAHCNIWTVTTAAYKPLDLIDPSYAEIAAAEFDESYSKMQRAYGDFNDTNNDGRVNLMYYNIDDGWEPGMGYVAGYFSQSDFESYNYLPMIHIDTYPGIQYVNLAGETKTHFEDTFGTVVHEFQHCINYSETGGMATWLNEALSGSAEELCYPGSGLYTRIQDWEDTRLTADELAYPPTEYKYNSFYGLHQGGSITSWSSAEDDIYARYGLVMLLTQYLYTKSGSTSVFKSIINANSGTTTQASFDALTTGTGWSLDEIFGGLFTAMAANDLSMGHGFRLNAGYSAADCHGLENVYNLLSPVIYTSNSPASIYGGGFITIKPKNGVYNPPSGASSALKYVGISLGQIGIEDAQIYPALTTMLMDQTAGLTLRRTPADANDFTVVWSSSDTSVATVEGNITGATVTSHAYGTATITARCTDNATGRVVTAAATVKVRNGYTYTRYEPTLTIEPGEPYMIGYDTGSAVYVMMNYNANADNSYKPRYYDYNNSYYSYGIKAVTDADGNITGIMTDVYPDAQPVFAEWVFEQYSSAYYKIRSGYEGGYYLCVYAVSSGYVDLYANPTGSNTNWQWNANTGRLSYYASSSLTKYVTYKTAVGDRQNLFCAEKDPTAEASIKLYKKVTGTVILDEPVYYTVTFVDWDGTVISTQQVEEGAAAAAPADPVREGYIFTGWDVSFGCITSDTVVTATYEQIPPQPGILLGDADCSGEVTFSDISVFYLFLTGSGDLTEQGRLNADFNQDGVLNFGDISEIYLFIIGS